MQTFFQDNQNNRKSLRLKMTSQYFICHRLKHYLLLLRSYDRRLGPLLKALREDKDLQRMEAQYTIEYGCIMYGQRICLYSKEIPEDCSGSIACWTLRNSKNEGHS
ncbi:hypothetical protein TNIN_311441 [Trichonephila inaurata madagascariensis]|uniref:Uncharacterized protein n=1 Tax=Trichonephila inaurata madagascariensis TaxID=2747483 RepID=A0A8X6XEK3_9ARAC|nr:hypothetical protein TNIN_311441 [Trichonephila inaurata madagascariensis]